MTSSLSDGSRDRSRPYVRPGPPDNDAARPNRDVPASPVRGVPASRLGGAASAAEDLALLDGELLIREDAVVPQLPEIPELGHRVRRGLGGRRRLVVLGLFL